MLKYNITNNFNLASEVYEAITRNHYRGHVPGSFSSASKISDPNYKWALTKHLQEDPKEYQVEYDVIDKFRTWQGNALHMAIEVENRNNPDVMCEETLTCEIGNETISGTLDYYHKKDHILKDYKSAPVYKWQRKDFDEWKNQANIYAYMLRLKGYPVKKIIVQAILYDWLPSDARHKETYPQNPLPEFEVEIWSDEKCYEYLSNKIEEKKNYYAQIDFGMEDTPCTPEERWADSVYKVYKDKSDRAMNGGSKFKTLPEAKDFESKARETALEKPGGALVPFRIEKKGDDWKRCGRWCGVAGFCKFYQAHLKEKTGEKVA